MTRHLTTTPVVGFVLALSVAMPAAARANPLLSGYGGPGQGNQAILGAALLNGPAGGGGGSAGGGSTGEGGSATTPTSGASDGARPSGASTSPRARGQSGAPASSPQKITRPSPDAASAYLAAERGHAPGQSGALGLTDQDLLYIILALVTLTLAGVLTRRLTQTTAPGMHS